MDPLTRLYPQPKPVSVHGVRMLVSEARLCDLAELQAWLDSLTPDPLDEIAPELADPGLTDEARRLLLVAAHGKAETPPAVRGEATGDRLFRSARGRAFELWVAAKRFQPDADPAWCAGAVVSDPDGCEAARAVFFARDSLRTIEAMILRDVPLDPPKKSRMTWGRVVDEVAQSHGWTYDYIFTLTVSQLVNARTGGEEEESPAVPLPADPARARAAIREAHKAWHGVYPEGESADG